MVSVYPLNKLRGYTDTIAGRKPGNSHSAPLQNKGWILQQFLLCAELMKFKKSGAKQLLFFVGIGLEVEQRLKGSKEKRRTESSGLIAWYGITAPASAGTSFATPGSSRMCNLAG